MELVVASSFVEAGIGCWDLFTGAEQLCYKLYADESPPLGPICVGERFLASSQLREPSASSGSVQYWSWSKLDHFLSYAPQVEDNSFPEESINPLAANSEGTYNIIGGGASGNIYWRNFHCDGKWCYIS